MSLDLWLNKTKTRKQRSDDEIIKEINEPEVSQPSSSTSIVSQSASSKTVRGDRQSESKAKSQSEQESNDKTPSFSTSKKKKRKIGSLSQKKSLSAVSGSDQEAGPTTTKQPKLRTFSSRWLTEFFWLENRDGYMY